LTAIDEVTDGPEELCSLSRFSGLAFGDFELALGCFFGISSNCTRLDIVFAVFWTDDKLREDGQLDQGLMDCG